MGGYIKLDQKILDWEWYTDPNTMRVFVHILLMANQEDKKYKGRVIPRGSVEVKIGNMADELDLTYSQVRTAIDKLKETEVIATSKSDKSITITVIKYGLYQDNRKEIARKSQGNSTEEKPKKPKKPKAKKADDRFFESDELQEAFLKFIEARKQGRKPMTEYAKELAVKKIEKLSEGNEDYALKMIYEAIEKGWQGIYPLKDERGRTIKPYGEEDDFLRYAKEGI